MRITEGKLVTLVITETAEDEDKHSIYLEEHPDLNLIDISSMGSGRYDEGSLKTTTWYWYVDQTIFINGTIGINLNEEFILLFDSKYARVHIRLPNEPLVLNYIEWAKQCIDLFKKDEVDYLLLPKIDHADIEILSTKWIKEREETITFLKELCAVFGDTDWDAEIHLKDILEKHLAKHLWKEKAENER